MIEVKRSPARVCWWVVLNGQVLATRDKKKEANALAESLAIKYGLNYETLTPVG